MFKKAGLNISKLELLNLVTQFKDNLPNQEYGYDFTVVEGYTQSAGKFPSTLGDAILIDCNTINHLVIAQFR